MYCFQQCLKILKNHIKDWNKKVFGHILEDKKRLEAEMNSIQLQAIHNGYTEDLKKQETALQQQLNACNRQEEILWKQKSRIRWHQEGERNTKFFHNSMIQRRQTNRIVRLKTTTGDTVQTIEEIEEELVGFFDNLLTELV